MDKRNNSNIMKKYFKPKSLTWIVGMSLVAYGAYIKDYTMISNGLIAIGIRGAIK